MGQAFKTFATLCMGMAMTAAGFVAAQFVPQLQAMARERLPEGAPFFDADAAGPTPQSGAEAEVTLGAAAVDQPAGLMSGDEDIAGWFGSFDAPETSAEPPVAMGKTSPFDSPQATTIDLARGTVQPTPADSQRTSTTRGLQEPAESADAISWNAETTSTAANTPAVTAGPLAAFVSNDASAEQPPTRTVPETTKFERVAPSSVESMVTSAAPPAYVDDAAAPPALAPSLQWDDAVAMLSSLGATNYRLEQVGNQVRCDVWVPESSGDATVERQISGLGISAASAAADAADRIRATQSLTR